jgi:RecA DNA recombination protein
MSSIMVISHGNRIPNPVNVVKVRQLLAERFPQLRCFPRDLPNPVDRIPTGLKQIDDLLQGGLVKGAITELVSSHAGSGTGLVLRSLLRATSERGQWMALVDAQDRFDPVPVPAAHLSGLLWVRCRQAHQALQATDLLVRDSNFSLVVLDLQATPAAHLRKISLTTWYRTQRVMEQTSAALLVLSPCAIVSGAWARLSLPGQFGLEALEKTEEELSSQLQVSLQRAPWLKQSEPAQPAEAG